MGTTQNGTDGTRTRFLRRDRPVCRLLLLRLQRVNDGTRARFGWLHRPVPRLLRLRPPQAHPTGLEPVLSGFGGRCLVQLDQGCMGTENALPSGCYTAQQQRVSVFQTIHIRNVKEPDFGPRGPTSRVVVVDGTPGGTQTPDLLVRSQASCSTRPRVHIRRSPGFLSGAGASFGRDCRSSTSWPPAGGYRGDLRASPSSRHTADSLLRWRSAGVF